MKKRRAKYGVRQPGAEPAPQQTGGAGEGELSVAETATYLGRSTEQVRRYLRDGALVGYRAGNQWFVPATALATFKSTRVEVPAMEERKAVVAELQALRARLAAKYGYLEVSGWLEEAREGLR